MKALKKAFNKVPWMLNKKYTKFFAISHIVGWCIAWIQTIWLYMEIRKVRDELRKK